MTIWDKTLRRSVGDDQNRDHFTQEMVNVTRVCSSEAQVLEIKLQELKAERAHRLKGLNLESLDEDIMAVERTLKLVKPTLT
jgi:hypothetical protein